MPDPEREDSRAFRRVEDVNGTGSIVARSSESSGQLPDGTTAAGTLTTSRFGRPFVTALVDSENSGSNTASGQIRHRKMPVWM